MTDANSSLEMWSWIFLSGYVVVMLGLGIVGMWRVKSGDDFAVARASYGPIFLAFAIVATSASGGTFLGLPAMAYEAGVSALLYAFVYPIAIYFGFLVSLKVVRRVGERFGNRSIPEYLGDRFESEALRIVAALFSLLLLFYLAAQLLAAAVLFTKVMGIDLLPALITTAVILFVYIVIGGAHADILTDGVQGALMLVLAIFVTWMFITGFGVGGGVMGIMDKLHEIDPALTMPLHPSFPILNSWWDIFAIAITHAPVGLLPHIGNKLWALKSDSDQRRLLVVAFVFAMLMATLTFGGLIARAVLGDALFEDGANPNEAIPVLFITLMPAWVAALIGAGVLAAVMSTADGLLVSTSQIFANDLYRRSIAPRLKSAPSDAEVDAVALKISRVAIVIIMIGSVWLAWESQHLNVALLIWSGVGGLMAATAGPMFLGALWDRSTRPGALVGFISGIVVFIVLKSGMLNPEWLNGTALEVAFRWMVSQSNNPFSCSALGAIASVSLMAIVSMLTTPPSEAHLDVVFGRG
ncbi:MAG: SSS family transporter [Gammaproteobacteria bacterium]|jgi:SSS family transporter